MDGVVLRRIIPSDNSCLFNAIGYVMEHNLTKAPQLRQVIAATVIRDPVTYNEAFLGKPNHEYCQWILNPDKWGGAIELAILSDYYGREIAAYDIQTTRCDLYGQGKGLSERVMVIYDGLHYDALAALEVGMFPVYPKNFHREASDSVHGFPKMAPFEDAPMEVDQTIFNVDKNAQIGIAANLAERLVAESHRARKFTDTGNFTLRCGVCQKGVVGQKEAIEHAKLTGHTNFQEYR